MTFNPNDLTYASFEPVERSEKQCGEVNSEASDPTPRSISFLQTICHGHGRYGWLRRQRLHVSVADSRPGVVAKGSRQPVGRSRVDCDSADMGDGAISGE